MTSLNRRTPAISAREAEVLAGVRDHLTNAEIADRLFISVRTAETHVASLLRKVGVDNRRALARAAARFLDKPAATRVPAPAAPMGGRLPQPLTRFIGRAAERAELAEAVRAHRLVTTVGPGGVGKTRLAIVVAGDVRATFEDGVCYVDLVPVTTGDMVALTVAQALRVPEQAGTAEDGLVGWLSSRHTLLVLDNCEHVVDAVAELVDRLLAGGDRLVILATSRSRLLLPFERAFVVPGLSLRADGATGDAVTLFCERAATAGSPAMPQDMDRVEEICAQLDGIALAIELAAARLPALGLDGLRGSLSNSLGLLTGRRRRDVRHQSLRATLDWSYQLLEPADQALLRRISVFADPFTSTAAGEVVAWSPVDAPAVAGGLARLADQSLIMPAVDGPDRRYRALETVRQYGAEQLSAHNEADETNIRHLRWCLAPASDPNPTLPELRAAISWASQRPEHRAAAYQLADRLGVITFQLGKPQESQHRYEQAASLAQSDQAAAAALHRAAAVAQSRHFGDEALRLHQAAADAAVRGGQPERAARDLAMAVELVNRGAGIIATPPNPRTVDAWLLRATALASGDPIAEARIAIAAAYRLPDSDPKAVRHAARAVVLAERSGDPATFSVALDRLTEAEVAHGALRAAMDTARRRVDLFAALPAAGDAVGLEYADALAAAADTAIATGDLTGAHAYAERIPLLPFLREEGHLATARLLIVDALTGDWDEVVRLADQFQAGWQRAGRPVNATLSRGAYAAATVFGIRGDVADYTTWHRIARDLTTDHRRGVQATFTAVFDALFLLHHERPGEAHARLDAGPPSGLTFHSGLWRGWHAALRAEAAVLAASATASDAIAHATAITTDNPVAATITLRAAALAGNDRATLLTTADALHRLGSRYQAARTLVLAGDPERAQGQAQLTQPPLEVLDPG